MNSIHDFTCVIGFYCGKASKWPIAPRAIVEPFYRCSRYLFRDGHRLSAVLSFDDISSLTVNICNSAIIHVPTKQASSVSYLMQSGIAIVNCMNFMPSESFLKSKMEMEIKEEQVVEDTEPTPSSSYLSPLQLPPLPHLQLLLPPQFPLPLLHNALPTPQPLLSELPEPPLQLPLPPSENLPPPSQSSRPSSPSQLSLPPSITAPNDDGVIKFISVNSDQLTDEQREMYESVLTTWKPGAYPKPTKRFICHKCNKEFHNYQNLYLHSTRVHSTEQSAVICNQCDKSFKNKHYLYMHRMNKHYSESEKCYCQFCLQEFRTGRALHIHVKRMHPTTLPDLKCDECDKEFQVPYKLKRHIERCHRAEPEKHKCHICLKLFKTNMNLRRHLIVQHTNMPRHPCVFCPMTFKSRHHMKRHVLNIHPPLESKVQCPECLKEFKNDQYLKGHMQMHSAADTKVTCELCSKTFHSPLRLKKHKKIVHPTNPKFRCDKCKKEFAHEHYLKRHVDSVHLEIDEALYEHECPECGKKFKMRKYLTNHLLRHEQQHLKRVSQMVKTVMPKKEKDTKAGKAKAKVPTRKSTRGRKKREDIEFIKCEPVTSSESGETESDSE